MTAESRASDITAGPLRPRRRWLTLSIPVVTLGLLFAALEIGFRVTESIASRRRGVTWALYDPDLGYRPNPGYGDTNAAGLRDHPITPKNGRFRLLMLGDSLGYYGDSIDDTWVGRMRTELGRPRGDASLQILNGSVRGYTNYQELLFLKKYGLDLEPDLVGIGFVLNDLHRILHTFKMENGRIVGETYDFSPEAVDSVGSPLFHLARRSHFLVWLRRTLDPAIGSVQYKVAKGFSFDYRPDMNTAWKDGPWADLKTQLLEMQALGKAHQFGLFMVIFPFADQYRSDYLAADREYVLKPQRRAAATCSELLIPCLDLFDALNPAMFLGDGIHLTAGGRQRVAEEVSRFLTERNLVPVADR